MTVNQIMSAVNNIKKGAFTRIVYATEPTLTAAAKKSGVHVVKHTEKVVRLGVKYHNIDAVKKAESERTTPKQEKAPWCHWEVEDILAKHNIKDDYYLSFAHVNNGHHTKTDWFIDGRKVTREEVESSGFVVPSYFKPSNDIPSVQHVNVANVISIGGKKHGSKEIRG